MLGCQPTPRCPAASVSSAPPCRLPATKVITVTDVGDPSLSGTGTIVTRGLVVTSFAPTPTGFTVSFNKPFNPSTINLYTTGGLPDDVLLATNGAVVSVRGSVLLQRN